MIFRPGLRYLASTLLIVIMAGCRDRSTSVAVQRPVVYPAMPQSSESLAESLAEQSCHKFVQRFYDWYFDGLNSKDRFSKDPPSSQEKVPPSAQEIVINYKPSVLDPMLLDMLRDDARAQADNPGYITGLDFDPYIGAQDWSGKYAVHRVTVKDGTCRAVLFGDDAGTQVEMVDSELQGVNGTWVFVNFHYPPKGSLHGFDLISQLKTLQEDRRKDKAKAAHK